MPKSPRARRKVIVPPTNDQRYKLVDRALKRFQYKSDSLLEVLHVAQSAFGFLDDQLLLYVSQQLKLPPSWVFGVATFYHLFALKPQGEHTCIVCMGTACYVKKAADILTALEQEFGIEPGQTTPDKKLSLVQARCMGSCGLAPVLVMDNDVHGKETPPSAVEKVHHALTHTPAPTVLEPELA